jgi:hypothetical protein
LSSKKAETDRVQLKKFSEGVVVPYHVFFPSSPERATELMLQVQGKIEITIFSSNEYKESFSYTLTKYEGAKEGSTNDITATAVLPPDKEIIEAFTIAKADSFQMKNEGTSSITIDIRATGELRAWSYAYAAFNVCWAVPTIQTLPPPRFFKFWASPWRSRILVCWLPTY